MSDPKNKKADQIEDGEVRKGRVVTVTASESRRRCGRRFPKGQPVEIGEDELSEAQWRALLADPVLKVSPPGV